MSSLFSSLSQYFLEYLLILPIILISLPLHETAHGYIAYKLGDPTARNLGRLTLNPIKHIDPIGFLCMLFFHFGWAKPVPINTRNFKNPKRDMALSALAGPVSNFLLAFLGVILYNVTFLVCIKINPSTQMGVNIANTTLEFFLLFAFLNINLGLFNLIPVPPLDGSRIFYIFLPQKWYFGVMKYEKYISIALIVLLWLGILSTPLGWLSNRIFSGMNWLVQLIPIF